MLRKPPGQRKITESFFSFKHILLNKYEKYLCHRIRDRIGADVWDTPPMHRLYINLYHMESQKSIQKQKKGCRKAAAHRGGKIGGSAHRCFFRFQDFGAVGVDFIFISISSGGELNVIVVSATCHRVELTGIIGDLLLFQPGVLQREHQRQTLTDLPVG